VAVLRGNWAAHESLAVKKRREKKGEILLLFVKEMTTMPRTEGRMLGRPESPGDNRRVREVIGCAVMAKRRLDGGEGISEENEAYGEFEEGGNKMKRQDMVWGVAVGALVTMLAVPTFGVETEAKKVAEDLSIVGVKSMEVVKSGDNYCALVKVEFENKGQQAVKLENGGIEVWFAPKEGERRTKVPEKPESEKEVTIVGPDGKESKVIQKVKPIEEIKTPETLFGKAVIGEKQDALVFKAAEGGKPANFEKEISLTIGGIADPETTRTIAQLANVMGDPKTKFVMRLIVRSQVALGVKDSGWISDEKPVKAEINLAPSQTQGYLFK
jgi:hypothetical protein